ncbi:hypothetical protein FNF29_05710 [Cafeteria roenbergensis]|nr:hypothetical protein FNF29_05710 [Cafeteria roenbergensis]|eukprot:KAA0149699.1 hypothetical protein FNF29_05710 [Cafeteria roenbergensis]
MAATGSVAGIFGAFPGVAIVVVSAIVFLTAAVGEYGARVDNKCLLLLYFMVVLAGFAAFLGLGAATLFGHGTAEAQAAKAWCAFPESAARGQVEFNCCGFRCPSDRPAMGGCPGGERLNGTEAAACSASADGRATCAIQPPPLSSSLPGCQSVAVGYLNDNLVPLFAVSFAFGFVLFAGMCVSGRLLCKSTGKGMARRRERGLAEAAHLNTAKTSDAGWIADVPAPDDSGAGVAASGPRSGPAEASASSRLEVPVPGEV